MKLTREQINALKPLLTTLDYYYFDSVDGQYYPDETNAFSTPLSVGQMTTLTLLKLEIKKWEALNQ